MNCQRQFVEHTLNELQIHLSTVRMQGSESLKDFPFRTTYGVFLFRLYFTIQSPMNCQRQFVEHTLNAVQIHLSIVRMQGSESRGLFHRTKYGVFLFSLYFTIQSPMNCQRQFVEHTLNELQIHLSIMRMQGSESLKDSTKPYNNTFYNENFYRYFEFFYNHIVRF